MLSLAATARWAVLALLPVGLLPALARAQAPAPADPGWVMTRFEPAAVGESLFYTVPAAASFASFSSHAGSIGVIAPQSFSLDHGGLLRGSLPQNLLDLARQQSVQVMPLVINARFSRSNAIRLLRSPDASDRAIGALVETARNLSLAGWQIDFEGLPSSQRTAFTRFVAEAAEALHRHGKLLSVAVAARTGDDPSTELWRTFSGVYDYGALAHSADFLSVMAYPENDSSHPGPLASEPWVERVVEHVLLTVPPDKISLGLPTYQTDWGERRVRHTVRERVKGKIKHIVHTVWKLFHRNGVAVHNEDTPLEWDPASESSYRIVGEGHERHVTWVEDERSFAAKLKLVGEYHLRGFSVWRIGLEDPHIWEELPPAPRTAAAAAAAARAGDQSAPPALVSTSGGGR